MAKVFISHSSNDKDIVRLFKDTILKNGIGLSDDDIFFTSSPETGVPIGKNIPECIKENMVDCEYAFLMISENYKKSEVCLNEMGAAMVLGKRLFPILLYDYDFDKVGWLIDRNLCAKVDDRERLDEIRDIFYEDGIKVSTSVWTRACAFFINYLPTFARHNHAELKRGILDYQLTIETNQKAYNKSLDELNEHIDVFTQQASQIIDEHNASIDIAERHSLMINIADLLNELSEYVDISREVAIPSMRASLAAAEGIVKLKNVPEIDKENLRNSLLDFKRSCTGNLEALNNTRLSISSLLDMEQQQILAKERVLYSLDIFIQGYKDAIQMIQEIIMMR